MNPFDVLKNMQNMQQQMQQLQGRLALMRVSGASGGGMVEVTINGKMEVQSIRIAPEIVDPKDISTLEVLVASAFNNAVGNAQEQLKTEATSLAGGMELPPGFPKL
ncbi:MAG: YbaB/EbfC family nucleoid-associated protein [Sphaerochaetaceae bacterium]